MEARIAIGALLERCPDLARDPSGGEPDRLPRLLLCGVRGLPVRW